MRALFDVNVLLALFDPAHLNHEPAQAWRRSNAAAGWASCPITQNGFIRIICQPRYPRPLAMTDALAVLTAQFALAGHEFWPETLSITDTARFDRSRLLGPSQITDVYLLSLAVANDGCLVSFDRAIPLAAVHGAGERNLVILP